MAIGPPGLFDFMGPPLVQKRRLRAGLGWLAQKRRRFSFFVFLSLVAHLALFGMVIVLGPRTQAPSSPAVVRAQDFKAFQESLRQVAADGRTPERLANALMGLSEKDIEEAFLKAPVLDYRLADQEKAGLYKTMLGEAMAEFRGEGAGEGPSALDRPLSRYFGSLRELPLKDAGEDYTLVRIDNPVEESAWLYKLSKETDRALESLSLQGGEAGDLSAEVGLFNEEGRLLNVPGEYFYRDSPYRQIAAAGAGLFYVVKGFPDMPSPGPENSRDRAGDGNARENLRTEAAADGPSPAFAVFLVPSGQLRDQPRTPTAAKPALTLPEQDRDRILDGLMTLPVTEQVRTFIRDYLQAHDPDSPDLARLTGEFIYRNLGMVFVQTGDPLSRGFDLLEEVFYDNISLDALVPYALKYPRSRTGAEILLALAASYEFERRAIVALDGSLDAAKKVLADPTEERFYVHNKEVKAYVLREVYRDLAAELLSRDFPALEPVLQRYRDEQLRIYDLLTGIGGAIKCRALYALGRLYWDEGRTELAMEIWKGTDPAFADETLTRIRGAIIERRRPLDAVPRIDAILGRETAGSKSLLLERIAKFHKWDRR